MPTYTHNGNQINDTVYAAGRNDIRNKKISIRKDINDTLSLDLVINGNRNTFEMTLDPAKYSGETLVEEIQKKLDEQLVDNGFEAGYIKASVGGINSGVVGSNDANALVFSIAKTAKLYTEGEYKIEGIKGSAALSVFYSTDGDLSVAYTTGMKELKDGIKITDDNNVLTFDYDKEKIELEIPSGEYTAKEMAVVINSLLEDTGKPLGAELTNEGFLEIYATKLGKHRIDNVDGSAKSALFYDEEGQIGNNNDVRIQCSSDVDDYMNIIRKRVNTSALDINSICISKVKYATKALDKLGAALEKVSSVRSYLGAMQNRMEHTVANNNNKEENLSASESVIRDTDMAKEMVIFSKHNILEQVMQSMLSHANQSNQGVLALFQ